MRAELITALAELGECVQLLRANPNHKGAGPGGGQFASSGGGGSIHGKHYAKRQRRRKRKLEQLRQKGHAKIAKLKSKHSKERKALRSSHREKGTSYSERRNDYKALRTRHKGESRQTVDTLKSEARQAFPRSTGKSDKAKEFRERVEKGTQKLGAIHAEERGKMSERHVQERKELGRGHRDERKEIRSAHIKERSKLVAQHNAYHKEDAQHIIANTKGQPPETRRATLEENRQTHSGRLHEERQRQREDHAEELASHRDQVASDQKHLARQHKETRGWVDKAHKAERREAIARLKNEIQGRGFDWTDHGISRVLERSREGLPSSNGDAPQRMARSRVHKAHSAEAILRHVLRQRGWTAIYGDGGLTGKQHLNLLEDVRAYCRMYLRHEAESFFDRYGVEDVDSDNGNAGFRPSRSVDIQDQTLPDLQQSVQAEIGRSDRGAIVSELQIVRSIASRAASAMSRFFDRTKTFIREAFVAGAMALKGPEPLTNAEIYAVDRLTRKQYEYLIKFEREVIANPPREIADLSSQVILVSPPPMTSGQFTARLESYGNAPWEVQNIGREVVRGQHVFQAERRVHLLSMIEHRPCKGGEQGCLEQSQMGWQPIGTLREIGDCFCMNNCDCYFEWKDPKGRIYVSPWGRHNPKGFNQPGQPGTQLPGIEYPSGQQPPAPNGPGPAIPSLPSGPGPTVKPPKKIKLKPVPKVGERYQLGGEFPPLRPDPTIQEVIDEAGSPHSADYYEEL